MDQSIAGNSPQNISRDRIVKEEQRFEGFDWFRAIFAIAIIAYKVKIFSIPKILLPSALTYGLSDYVLSGMYGALAVPVFLQISLFLFYVKSKNVGLGYFMHKRLPRLVSLYLFWVVAITVFDILFVDKFEAVKTATSSIKQFVLFVISGNNTPYFFFFSLTFITIIAEFLIWLFGSLKKPSSRIVISYGLLIFTSILVFSFSTLQPIINYTGIQSPLLDVVSSLTSWDYNPLNFLPYIFTAAIVTQEYNQGKLAKITKPLKQKLYILLALSLTFFALEWILTSNKLLIQVDQAPLDHYMRLSLVFASWLLLYVGLLSKQKIPASIKFLSSCSLGIYGFHVFFIFKRLLPLENLPVMGPLFQAVPVLQILTNFLITLIGSIALTLLFRQIKPLKRFV